MKRADDPQLELFIAQLGASLRAARNAAGMSLQAAADYLEVQKATVGHWETGTNPIGADKLFRLARRYGTTVAALVASQITRADVAAMVLKLDAADDPQATERLRATLRRVRTAQPEERLVGKSTHHHDDKKKLNK